MKKQVWVVTLILTTTISYGQPNEGKLTKKSNVKCIKNLYAELGGSYSSFQDVKYSKVQYGGGGGIFSIGFNSSTINRFWEIALLFAGAFESGKTHGATSTVMHPTVLFKYLRTVKDQLKVGARIDLFDFYLRHNQGLGNNGTYSINAHNLYGSLMREFELSEKWILQSGIDIGLLSFMRESTGFAYSAPQKATENGLFDYQNPAIRSPFRYQFFEWNYFGNNLNLITSVWFRYQNRIAIGYSWNVRRFASVKSYPVVIGTHSVILKYNIVNKQ